MDKLLFFKSIDLLKVHIPIKQLCSFNIKNLQMSYLKSINSHLLKRFRSVT